MIAQQNPTAAYIHIPFCRRRCYYCDFPISVVGDNIGNALIMIEDYIAALIKDIQLTVAEKEPLQTIFFGGGTPSLLSAPQINQLIKAIASRFELVSNPEISLEIDPGTFNQEQLQGYLDIGINRFSLGVQTFDEQLLKVCGRSHTLKDILHSVEIISQLGVANFSLDLITGLPHQTIEHCQASLTNAIAIAPQHLSCYDLVLEPVTAFGKQYQPGKTPLPNDYDTAQMYRLTRDLLTANGYEHYEISNYAKLNYQCQHNRVYWENKPYYGFGMGAASYVAGKRFNRPRTRREYYAWLEAGAQVEVAEVSPTDYLLEGLMLGLRLVEGIDLKKYSENILQKILASIEPYYSQEWIEIIDEDGKLLDLKQDDLINLASRLRLQDPDGFLFSNTILAALFEKFD
ncbi:oxygen-independent coproporphyrinogen III oxidase [Chondrocystis sp. NIES-4102]|nr:oxygen-independent coproporphyrinogen III oxidase [Chondrocystis sp. NIES-4102]